MAKKRRPEGFYIEHHNPVISFLALPEKARITVSGAEL